MDCAVISLMAKLHPPTEVSSIAACSMPTLNLAPYVALYLLDYLLSDGTMLSLSTFSTDSYILPLFIYRVSGDLFEWYIIADRLGVPPLICLHQAVLDGTSGITEVRHLIYA